MKFSNYVYFALCCSTIFVLSQCKPMDPELYGNASTASFTFTQAAPGDTLPFVPKVTFTNNSTDGFLYQWNFGDNSALSAVANPVHTYKVGGNYTVSLTSVGTNGSNSKSATVPVSDASSNPFFKNLTNGSFSEWTWSNDADAIKVLSPDGNDVYFSGTPAGCQADDIYKFSADGSFAYDANGSTFDVAAGYSCVGAKDNASKFKVIAKSGSPTRIILNNPTVGRSFIGTTDLKEKDAYTVTTYGENNMTLRSVIENSGGVLIETKLIRVVKLTLDDIKRILTGGSSKKWRLDPSAGANPIVVGTEDAPSQYYGGGPIDTNCQSDDEYTFSANNTLTYDAKGSTFDARAGYTCAGDLSFNQSYTFSATAAGVAGLATIQLPVGKGFIGVTDVPSENTYRIIEISNNKMVLRAGNGSGTVFQFKFIAVN
jgi:PKD repeat protein